MAAPCDLFDVSLPLKTLLDDRAMVQWAQHVGHRKVSEGGPYAKCNSDE